MATITGLTAERMQEIEAASVIDGEIRSGNLWLIKHGGEEINAGPVIGPPGPAGPAGPAGISAIPGEVKLWPGSVLPALATYGKWVWADGAFYPNATYPQAAAHIASQWRTFAGASDPGPSNFRVPDLRGLVAAGMDAMPGGSRANPSRMTRAVAITLAGKTGEETHIVNVNEMPAHNHNMNGQLAQPQGGHYLPGFYNEYAANPGYNAVASWWYSAAGTFIGTDPYGGGQAHENVQPTVFVPYIVKLDG